MNLRMTLFGPGKIYKETANKLCRINLTKSPFKISQNPMLLAFRPHFLYFYHLP